MFKIGMTDRLSLYIIILFYSGAFIVGYNFLNKDNDQKMINTYGNLNIISNLLQTHNINYDMMNFYYFQYHLI